MKPKRIEVKVNKNLAEEVKLISIVFVVFTLLSAVGATAFIVYDAVVHLGG